MGYLDKLLEKMKKEAQDAIDKATETTTNNTSPDANQNAQENEKVEVLPESPVEEEKEESWISGQINSKVEDVVNALEKAKEEVKKEQENPSEPEQTPDDSEEEKPSDTDGGGSLEQPPDDSEEEEPSEKEEEGSVSYPQIEGETVKQEGITDADRETESQIMAGNTPKDNEGNEEKLPVILPEYELMVYDALSDEEIVALVRAQLEAYKNAGISSINQTAENEKNNAQTQRGSIEQSKAETERATNELYDNAKDRIDSDMIKRGLARSSIASLLVSESENARANTLSNNEMKYRNSLQEIDNKIAEAESKRQKALETFNIEYAVKYAEEVRKLQEERAEKEAEVLKYNNSIKEKLYDDKLAGLKTQESLSKQSGSVSSNKSEDNNTTTDFENNTAALATGTSAEKLYQIYREKLLNMSKDEADKEIRNETLYAKTLPTVWYMKLADEFRK